MDLALLIDRIAHRKPVSLREKKAVLLSLEQTVQNYRLGALLQPDAETQELVGEMVGWLLESLHQLSKEIGQGADSLKSWERLESCLFHLAAEIEEATRAFWTACGPSSSVTANQLHHLCLLPADPEVTKERLRFLASLRGGLQSLVSYQLIESEAVREILELVEELEIAVRQEQFDLTPVLKSLFAELERVSCKVPLYLLDQDLSEGTDWVSRFSNLSQAYLDNQLQSRDLLIERELFLQSLEKLADQAAEVGQAESKLLDRCLEHLRSLERHLHGEEELEDWLEECKSRFDKLRGDKVH